VRRLGHILDRASRSIVFATLVLALAACAAMATIPPAQRHLVLISIDALRPEFYLDPSFDAPALRALVAEGSHARAVEGVFPTVTYPSHATIVTGLRPARHGILFNLLYDPARERTRWYEETADLRATTLWMWARAAGLTTAAVSWPVTLGAAMDWVIPERDYHVRPEPLRDLLAATTPGLFERIGVMPDPAMFKDVVRWDTFLTDVASGIIRTSRPNLLLLHLVQADARQHQHGREGAEVTAAVARLDRHIARIREVIAAAGIADRTTMIVTGDHGVQNISHYVYPNNVLARAGLRNCPRAAGSRATVHASGGGAAVFVDPPGDAALIARAERALRDEAAGRYTVLTRAELDALGAMTGAALGLEASPGWALGTSCDRGMTEPSRTGLGTHGFLPSRPSMATGFIATGTGVRAGVALERVRLIDIAPTAAHLLGIPAPPVEGRVLREILE
jgi:predicted AlkP superfamily pyrophosphatase or phosphodiesterase